MVVRGFIIRFLFFGFFLDFIYSFFELSDTLAKATHHFWKFLSSKKQQSHATDEKQFGSTDKQQLTYHDYSVTKVISHVSKLISQCPFSEDSH